MTDKEQTDLLLKKIMNEPDEQKRAHSLDMFWLKQNREKGDHQNGKHL